MLRLAVEFHERLSSEIKDEIESKLASALRALKSRISRICGINELERRVSLAPEAGLGWDEGLCPAWVGFFLVAGGLGLI